MYQGLTVFYLLPVQEEIIGDCQCGFRRNGPITDHMFWICNVLGKKKNKGNTKRQSIEFMEAHDSVKSEVSLSLVSP